MSGYNLAGGKHPGQDLARARKKWFRQHLARQHRAAGSVMEGRGAKEEKGEKGWGHGDPVTGLRAKRAEITKELLQLASAPSHKTSHGGEPERLGLKARTFGHEVLARRSAFSTSLAGDDRKRGGAGGGSGEREGGEAQRLNALVEKEVLAKGADAYSRENASLRRAIRERRSGLQGDARLRAVPRSGGGEGTARAGGGEREERANGVGRLREQEGERERDRERQAREAARRVWSDSLHSRAAAGFERASKAARTSPYKAAMTGSVFEHFLHHPSPRMLTGQSLLGVGAAATHASKAAMVARAGVRTHSVEGREVPSGYTGFAGF